MIKLAKNKGFIKTVVIIVIGLLIAKYAFGISLKDIFDSKIVKDIWFIIKKIFELLWEIVITTIDFVKIVLVKAKELISK